MFDFDASAQAACQFLRRHGGRMPRAKLAKLAYLAERKAIEDDCTPITGDSFVALKTGPVPANLYALLMGEGEEQAQKRWDARFKREGEDVVALKELPSNPFIRHESLVDFGKAQAMRAFDILKKLHSGELALKEDLGPAVFDRVLAAAKSSRRMRGEPKSMLFPKPPDAAPPL